jgi:hypothetical protein
MRDEELSLEEIRAFVESSPKMQFEGKKVGRSMRG